PGRWRGGQPRLASCLPSWRLLWWAFAPRGRWSSRRARPLGALFLRGWPPPGAPGEAPGPGARLGARWGQRRGGRCCRRGGLASALRWHPRVRPSPLVVAAVPGALEDTADSAGTEVEHRRAAGAGAHPGEAELDPCLLA